MRKKNQITIPDKNEDFMSIKDSIPLPSIIMLKQNIPQTFPAMIPALLSSGFCIYARNEFSIDRPYLPAGTGYIPQMTGAVQGLLVPGQASRLQMERRQYIPNL